MAIQAFEGSCHCGAVRFEFEADPDQGTMRCTCTFCTKRGLWSVRAKSPQSFRLLQGEEQLADYTRSDFSHHRFCKACGVGTHSHGHIPQSGGDYVSVSVRALDGKQELFEGKPIRYLDGLANTWNLLKSEPYQSPVPKSAGSHRS